MAQGAAAARVLSFMCRVEVEAATAVMDETICVGCDIPFLKLGLLRALASWADRFDLAIPRHREQTHMEPLHATYRRSCLPAIEAVIRANRWRVVSFFPQVRVRYVTSEDVAQFDPQLRSFRNINTPEQWEAAQAEWKR